MLASGVFHGKLIESQALTSALGNTVASRLSEAKCSNTNTRNIKKTDIICNCSNNNSEFVALAIHEASKLAECNWSTNGTALHETVKNNAVELGVGLTSKVGVELQEIKK